METLTAKLEKLKRIIPKRSGYAQEIVDRLSKKDIHVTYQQVYRTITGRMFHKEIIDEFILLAEEHKKQQQELSAKITEIINE